MKEEVEKKKTALEEAKKEVAEEKEKLEEAFAASLIQGDNEIHKQLEEKVERIRVLEIETENLKEENKELRKAKDTTSASSSALQVEETENVVKKEDGFVAVEDPQELQQKNLEKTSKGSEEAGTSVQKSVDLRKSMPQKRTSSETKENVLVSMRKEHEMFRTIIESGLSQLIQDEDTPVTMLGSLKALKHYTTSSSVDCDMQPQRKKRKKHPKIQKVVKQEYFEYDEIKREPVEPEKNAQASEQQHLKM